MNLIYQKPEIDICQQNFTIAYAASFKKINVCGGQQECVETVLRLYIYVYVPLEYQMQVILMVFT